MKRQKYDLIFGLGPVCSCTQSLRRAGLQHLSFPYDWIAHFRDEDKTSPQSATFDLRTRADTVAADFAGWFQAGDLVKFGTCADTGKDWYHDTTAKLIVLHDFPAGVPFEQAYPAVVAKYRRRIDRLAAAIRGSRRVLVLRLDRPGLGVTTPIEDCDYAVRTLARKFPGVHFDLLLLQQEDGRPANAPHEEHPFENVTVVRFDYPSKNPKSMPFSPDLPLVADFLRSRYAVRDYRTLGERFRNWKKNFVRRLERLRRKFSVRT